MAAEGDDGRHLEAATTGRRRDPTAALAGLSQAIQGAGGLDGILDKLRAGRARRSGRLAGCRPGRTSRSTRSARSGARTRHRPAAVEPDPGIDIGQLLPMLATFLPQIINMLTPDGSVPSGGLNGAAGGMPRPRWVARRPDRWDGCGSPDLGERPRRDARATRAADGRRSTVDTPVDRRRNAAGDVGCPCPPSSSVRGGPLTAPTHPARMDAADRPSPPPASTGSSRREPVVWLSTVRPDGSAAPRPDLVLVGRRGRSRVLQAGRPEGPQPAGQPVGDARARRCRGRLRRRAAAKAEPSCSSARRARSCPPAISPSTRRGWAPSASAPEELRADLFAGDPDRARGLPRLARAHDAPQRQAGRSTGHLDR